MNQPTQFFKVAIFMAAISLSSFSQAQMIEEEFDALTAEWLEISEQLKTYDGLGYFCKSKEFRETSLSVLRQLHHYDSLILEVLLETDESKLGVSHREYKHTLRDIEKFEEEYGIREFIAFLKEGCVTWKGLEKDKEMLVKESGMYSYDGQLLVLETQLGKFLKHIDKKVIAIDEHIHLIHIDQVRAFGSLENQ